MQALFVLFIGALIGVSYCDDCIAPKARDCIAKIPKVNDDFCYVQPKVLACFKIAARDCGKPYVHDIEKTELILTQMCKKGAPLNKEFLKYKDCLGKAFPKQTCITRMEEVCPNIGQVAQCLSDFAGDSCGIGAEKLVAFLLESVLDMTRGHCDDFIIN